LWVQIPPPPLVLRSEPSYTRRMATCSQCGQENRPEASFCDACGVRLEAAVAPREERKVITVLFADLVGFTSRTEQLDPEDVRAVQDPYWQHLRAELERHGGTVEKFIGDAVVALFGAPVAHEDDPERAVRAALAIRDWARDQKRIQVRIAVTTGEALVRLGARPLAGEGMASGDVVNAASRLQSAAPTNGVLVDETTYRATKQVIECAEAEPVAAKGKAELLAVWEAVRPRSRFGIDVVHRARTPLVGRERELDLLRDALVRARRERSPQLVTLVGEPGIGKSRLVYELRQSLEPEPAPVHWRQGRSLPYGDGVAFWALGEIVKGEAGILETDAAAEAEAKLARVVDAAVGEEAEWVARHLRQLVGLGGDVDTGDRRDEAFAAWRRFFEGLAEERPLVLVFEDLHWADDGLLDFVDHLVEWAVGFRMLVVCTGRPELLERRTGWGGGKLNVLTVALSPLSEKETAALVDALVEERKIDTEERGALLERVGGNPLYAEQFALLSRERGSVAKLPPPETVQGTIAARLDALPLGQKALLRDAAVVGRIFWSGALGGEPAVVRAALHTLERKEFVRRERPTAVEGQEQYTFRHVLVRDVAYGQIPRGERGEKHLRVAHWLESLGRREDHADMLAHHYVNALEYVRAVGGDASHLAEQARRALIEAGARASALNSFRIAANYYEQALALSPGGAAEHPPLLFALAEALHRSGADDQQQRMEQARDGLLAIGDFERAAEAEAMLAEAASLEGRDQRCLEHMERALALLQHRGASAARARVLTAVARHRATRDEYEAVIELATEALTMAEALDLAEVRADALITLGRARVFLADARGVEDIEQGLALALATNSLIVTERGYEGLYLAIAIEATGEFRRLRELYEESTRVAERLGNIHLLRSTRAGMITTQRFVGEWDDALQAADAYIAECEGVTTNPMERGVRLQRAYIRQARDDSAGALEDIEKALAASGGTVFVLGVFLLVELGRLERARTLAREIVRRYPWIGSSEFALVAADVGYLGKFRAALDALPRRRPPDIAAQAIIDGRLVEAANVLTEMGRFAAAARVRLRAAETLATQGRRTEANEQLDKALRFYRSVGATRYIREAEGLLAATA
jgi:class 3 adenylate cyclase/tetratricopeptide (TPR) repeat protein